LINPIVLVLSNKKHWVRWEAAKALGQIGDKSATEALTKALEDNEFDVRWLAAEGLIIIGRDSIKLLLEALGGPW
jgi:HEAT repeat protein